MAFLVPDQIKTEKVGSDTITIKVKITPDGARATKDICSYVKKGDLVKANVKLNNGTGKPKGITVHNTADINVSNGTTPAEQYARATYPNGNMGGAAVHYWVYKTDIWQQLSDDEQGWHASDGSVRRVDHRGGTSNGNLDTIAIECIGNIPESEDTLAKLVSYLCDKYGLEPYKDVYTHNYWMHGKDVFVKNARKNCPAYILDHWAAFLIKVQTYYDSINVPAPVPVIENVLYRVHVGNYPIKAMAVLATKRLKLKGFFSYVVKVGSKYRAQAGAFQSKANADALADKIKNAGLPVCIVTDDAETITDGVTTSKLADTQPAKQPTPEAPAVKVGSKVMVKQGAKTYAGGNLSPLVYINTYDVIQIKGDRVVIGIGKAITAAVKIDNLIVK